MCYLFSCLFSNTVPYINMMQRVSDCDAIFPAAVWSKNNTLHFINHHLFVKYTKCSTATTFRWLPPRYHFRNDYPPFPLLKATYYLFSFLFIKLSSSTRINTHLVLPDNDKWAAPTVLWYCLAIKNCLDGHMKSLVGWEVETMSPHIPRDRCPEMESGSAIHVRTPRSSSLQARIHGCLCGTLFPTQRLPSFLLTGFGGGGALLAGRWPTAHSRAAAQVEPVPAHRLQVLQEPLSGVGVIDVHGNKGSHFLCVVN